jgi:D-glycero-D-manno-heptose 1,7-bisphosphate phosphatase
MKGRDVLKRALFLDRDGTLVEPRHYPSRPEDLALARETGPWLRVFQRAGWALVVITNQSGIARGYFTEEDLGRMHDRLREMLRKWGVELDAIHYCPHHVDGIIPHFAVPCGCRKPEPGMLLAAASALGIDLPRSWMVGDILDDVAAGNRAGCRTVLVDLGTEQLPTLPDRRPTFTARSTAEALRRIAECEALILSRSVHQPGHRSDGNEAVRP